MSLYTRINNETKKEGQMPLHYPADRVYLDGDKTKTVQDAVNRGSVSVTADGVKTAGELLDQLKSAVDFSKLTNDSKIDIVDSSTGIHNIHRYSYYDGGYFFDAVRLSSNINIFSIRLVPSGNSQKYIYTNGSISNTTSDVFQLGSTITLYY